MGARQSKRSVDISGTPKKGGELENGSLATNVEEKLEKIAEADSAAAKVNANGSTTTTSTVTAEQQETAAAAAADSTTATPAESGEAPSEKTEVPSEQAEKAADVSTTTVEENKEEPSSPASPSENTPSSTEEGASSEKKKNKKKKWSFRSFSFSKKDKVKPASKEEKQQEILPEGNENTQSEQVNSAEANNATPVQSEEPPPLPSSPPPTPADETSEKEETLTVSEAEIEASGGGEGLAEPIEEAELEDSKTSAPAPAAPVVEAPAVPAVAPAPVEAAPVAAVAAAVAPLTNGTTSQNGDYKEQNGKHAPEEEDEASPVHERKPSVDSVTAKIGSLKLQIASENSEQPAQNGVSDETATLNGVKETDVSSTENATAVATVEN